MRAYETTFILVPSLEADGVTHEIDSVKKMITGRGGEITAEREWGRRRLAYPIRDFSEGIYHILRFSLDDSEGLQELNRHFRLNENVLRALVIRDEGTPLDYVSQTSESEQRDTSTRESRSASRPAPARARGTAADKTFASATPAMPATPKAALAEEKAAPVEGKVATAEEPPSVDAAPAAEGEESRE